MVENETRRKIRKDSWEEVRWVKGSDPRRLEPEELGELPKTERTKSRGRNEEQGGSA